MPASWGVHLALFKGMVLAWRVEYPHPNLGIKSNPNAAQCLTRRSAYTYILKVFINTTSAASMLRSSIVEFVRQTVPLLSQQASWTDLSTWWYIVTDTIPFLPHYTSHETIKTRYKRTLPIASFVFEYAWLIQLHLLYRSYLSSSSLSSWTPFRGSIAPTPPPSPPHAVQGFTKRAARGNLWVASSVSTIACTR